MDQIIYSSNNKDNKNLLVPKFLEKIKEEILEISLGLG